MNNKEVEEEHDRMSEKMAKEFGGFMIEEAKFKAEAIGYLCIREKYDVGEVPEGFVDKLNQVFHSGCVIASMGHHECEYCINQGVKELPKDAKSSCEKRVRDKMKGKNKSNEEIKNKQADDRGSVEILK